MLAVAKYLATYLEQCSGIVDSYKVCRNFLNGACVMSENKEPALSRRSNNAYVASLKPLSENQFWQQSQSILMQYLNQTEYGPALYVPVQAGGGKPLFEEIKDFLNPENSLTCLLLIGQYGVGKTSCLSAFSIECLKVNNGIGAEWIWIYFDGNKFALDLNNSSRSFLQPLSNVISDVISEYLKRYNLTFDDMVADCIAKDIDFARLRLIKPKIPQKEFNGIKELLLGDATKFVHVSLRYLVRQTGAKKVVLVLDNLDPLKQEIQVEGVHLATHLSKACDIKAVMAARRQTDAQIRYNNDKAIVSLV